MPPLFRSTSVRMKDKTDDRRWILLWAVPASLILHVLIAALLFYGVPPTPPEPPQEEQAVNVAIVPPPEPPKPKPAPAPAPKPPEAKKPPEPKVEKPPEPKVEKPPEQKVEKPPVPEKPSTIETLKPVFKFGDKDTGPRKSLDGASAQDNSPAKDKDKDKDSPVVPKEAETKPAASPDSEKQTDTTKADEKPVTAPKDTEPAPDKPATPTQDTGKPEADKQEAGAQDADKQPAAEATPLTAEGGDAEIALPALAEAPKPRPQNTPKPSFAKASKSGSGSAKTASSADVAAAISRGYSGLPGVRKLYSQGATGDPLATSAMGDMPRDQRGAKLCASALQQQLLDGSYFADLLPLVPLKTGTDVVDAPNAAFHARSTWYGLSFRCELDTDATTVLSFTYQIGAIIPPDQWGRLGLPTRY